MLRCRKLSWIKQRETKMKRTIFTYGLAALMCLLLAVISPAYAQQGGGGNKGETIEALKVAFITKNLSLTSDEAQKFWPIYNAYEADLATLRQNFGVGKGSNLQADQQLDYEQKKLDLKKRYKAQFETAIGKQKTDTLYNLEEKFRQMLKELRQQRQQQNGGGGWKR